MNRIKNITIFFICLIDWSFGFSQIDMTKLDSLKRLDQQYNDGIENQLFKIDSLNNCLKKEKTILESNKFKIDSLKAENERLKIIRDKYCEELNFEMIDSVDLFKMNSGYYFRILPQENDQDKFNNEIEWLYVSESNEVKEFTTANYEYCMSEMYFDRKPKNIYRQIITNQEKFDSLYLICNEGQKLMPSEAINGEFIVLSRKQNSICISDILIFQRKGIIRRVRTENGIANYPYAFIGK